MTSASSDEQARPLAGEPVAGGVLAQRGQQRLDLALLLHAQEVDDVGLGQHPVEVVADRDRPARQVRREQRRRRDQRDLGAEQGEREHVGARHARVLHVADDGDAQSPSKSTRADLADRVAVEQGLGRVLVPAVAGVDHRCVDPAGHLPRDTGRRVAHDDRVDAHRLDGLDGVAQRLALLHRRRRHGEVHRVGRQPLGGGLERQPRARGLLEEQRDDRAPPQGRDLGDRPLAHLDEGVGDRQDLVDLVGSEVRDREQMLATAHRGPPLTASARTSPSSTPSPVTLTISSRRVGRFLPT